MPYFANFPSSFYLFTWHVCGKLFKGRGLRDETELNFVTIRIIFGCCPSQVAVVFNFYHKGFNSKKHAILNWKMQMLQQDFSLICGVVGLLYAQRDVILNSLYLTKSQLLYSKISNFGSPGEEMFFWRKQSNIFDLEFFCICPMDVRICWRREWDWPRGRRSRQSIVFCGFNEVSLSPAGNQLFVHHLHHHCRHHHHN